VVLAKGYGLANVELDVPVKAETMFQSGSVGKQFTAVAVMLQVEGGKLRLDDAVTKYFKDAPASWGKITVRHLLTHTSGIPDWTEKDVDLRRDYTEEELARVAYRLKLEFEPGSRWNYSNTGYVMLGILVHKVSGKFYGDVLTERVFKPLGMKTARIISEEEMVPNRAAGYRLVDGELRNQEWVAPKLNTTADGSLYVSVLDMIAWDRGLREKAILKPESWAEVFTPVRLTSGRTYPYGFGWFLDETGGAKREYHGGAWQGFKSFISRYLGEDLTIVVLANLADADPDRLNEVVAGAIDGKLVRSELAPIPDREPEVTARLLTLLDAASKGTLSPAEFAFVRAGFFPDVASRYEEILRPLGKPQHADLLQRREVGDDRIYRYNVTYEKGIFLVQLALAPNGKVSGFGLRPR
jgi:CubicO group peptidase (beta-lactamase class C family)